MENVSKFIYIGIIIWKTILYFISLVKFANLRGWRLITTAVLSGLIILIMAAVDGYLGAKCPVI